jgi:hypothetical protein
MPALLLHRTGQKEAELHPHGLDGAQFAKLAVEFAALGKIAKDCDLGFSHLHLSALAIELAFKSLALRIGATPRETKNAGHKITKIIALIEQRGVTVSARLKRRLSDDKWFESLLASRYPAMRSQIFHHRDYPEMVAEILEIPCNSPLSFKGKGALTEILSLADQLKRRR